MSGKKADTLNRIKTGSFERRLSLTRMGLLAGTRYVASSASTMFLPREQREARRREALGEQARYLVEELGKLKGSVVKIGQMMALYGEHFLPEEVTAALHTLEDRTVALEWPVIRRELEREIGRRRIAELEIDPVPIGAASLGQVHLAHRKLDGKALCLKIQYPGVAAAIDSDIDAVVGLLQIGRMLGSSEEFGAWLDEVRAMLHREVDYVREARKTAQFHDHLRRDTRFVVPEVLADYSSAHVLATSFEHGYSVTSADVEALPLERRNELGRAFLELFLREIFEWRELQTDPNFGNYRVRPATTRRGHDRLVLLDFGAVQEYPDSFIDPLAEMIRGAYHGDIERVMQGALDLRFMQPHFPQAVQRSFAKVCAGVIEPLVGHAGNVPREALSASGQYRWKHSDLPRRIARQASRAAFSTWFQVPPSEFVFLNRKLIGVYTFIAVLGAEFNGADIIEKYL
ncbi:MAG: AarF/ABC1/UbiB kinase family protein [Gammaproteobacteria bacterium]|nr:AarF/ABC1/UbiB kinase family protein [Gammaproteobacteria bacterium]MBK6581898.1 AarF/ABC1/UbiB kinase family protein [Gammaproteobacteria bacterium]MBK7169397.1 AarF/ABC1/UbiB kinase family protein [Gammaproteobacteria bacterium]MBK7520733.1 AarF/ABC1/UbiB kinase family protein [Gammaproteobacteria bacterium]MBK8308283.1 AarF/ABC1/UbiB kinase family protein [Gammaproteobacteria bacterium]